MTQKEFIGTVSRRTGVRLEDTKRVILDAFIVIAELMEVGDNLLIRSFGRFTTRHLGSRTFVSNMDGEIKNIGERDLPKFIPSTTLKERLRANNG